VNTKKNQKGKANKNIMFLFNGWGSPFQGGRIQGGKGKASGRRAMNKSHISLLRFSEGIRNVRTYDEK
jgi:hypothetical protein